MNNPPLFPGSTTPCTPFWKNDVIWVFANGARVGKCAMRGVGDRGVHVGSGVWTKHGYIRHGNWSVLTGSTYYRISVLWIKPTEWRGKWSQLDMMDSGTKDLPQSCSRVWLQRIKKLIAKLRVWPSALLKPKSLLDPLPSRGRPSGEHGLRLTLE